MSWFQLDPQSIAARTEANGPDPAPPTLWQSIARGVAGFTAVSVAGFAPWALFGRWFYPFVGEAGLYSTCAAVFIGLSGLLLHRLILGTGSLPRFYKLFSIAFAAYSAVWIACWLWLGGDRGSHVGLLGGTAAMGCIFANAFAAWRSAAGVIAALFVLNAAGYFAGQSLFHRLISWNMLASMLLWGACFGLGLGAGLGVAFHLCQAKARAFLIAQSRKSSGVLR